MLEHTPTVDNTSFATLFDYKFSITAGAREDTPSNWRDHNAKGLPESHWTLERDKAGHRRLGPILECFRDDDERERRGCAGQKVRPLFLGWISIAKEAFELCRYILWCMQRYRQNFKIKDFAHDPKPPKKIRGWADQLIYRITIPLTPWYLEGAHWCRMAKGLNGRRPRGERFRFALVVEIRYVTVLDMI